MTFLRCKVEHFFREPSWYRDYNNLLIGTASYFNDNLNWLNRNRAKNFNSFLCPGTQNSIRTTNQFQNPLTGKMDIVDLGNFARNRDIPRGLPTGKEVLFVSNRRQPESFSSGW